MEYEVMWSMRGGGIGREVTYVGRWIRRGNGICGEVNRRGGGG